MWRAGLGGFVVVGMMSEHLLVDDFTQYVAQLGVGGIIAGLLFLFYRKDQRQHAELWKGQSEILIQVVKDNTVSNTRLVGAVEALERRLDRG